MLLNKIYDLTVDRTPLEHADIPIPLIKERELLVKVTACGVCHTELDEIEGRTPPPEFPVVPGHQIVGRVEKAGNRTNKFKIGDRVGIAWINSSCGQCSLCIGGNENLCPEFKATGRDVNGGYAEYANVHEDFAYHIPEMFSDSEAAPLLCAGAIGYRSLKLSGISNGKNLGLSGFGASAHLVLKMVKHMYPETKVFVFARNEFDKSFAKELGAYWTGDFSEIPPEQLSTIIDTTPAWKPVIESLKSLKPGGRLVINAIRKEDRDKETLTQLDYPKHLWMEKEIKSVANVTRDDVKSFLKIASEIPLKPEFHEFNLDQANSALLEFKDRNIKGAKVLKIS